MTETSRLPKTYADAVARLRVPSGFLLLVLFVVLSSPSLRALALGLPVSLAGVALRAWAAGHLAKNERLATTGPYAFTRNPLYLGTALAALGLLISARSVVLAALFAAVFLLVYFPVIELESQHLRKLFAEYETYCSRVPLLLPQLRPADSAGGWQARLYRKNEEWRGLLAYAVALAFLAGKSFIRGSW